MTMITQEFRTVSGDFNLDGNVDAADYVVWRSGRGVGTQYAQGDANLDGIVDDADLAIWRSNFGFVRQALSAGAGRGAALAAVPESSTAALMAIGFMLCGVAGMGSRTRSFTCDRFTTSETLNV
jgi:hypothetical protein